MKWRNGLSAVIGAWFIISPWVLGVAEHPYVVWNSVIVGAIQVVVSVWALQTVHVPTWRAWQNWMAALCGFWFLIVPFMGHFEEGSYYALAAASILTMVLNLWTLMANPDDTATRRGPKAPT